MNEKRVIRDFNQFGLAFFITTRHQSMALYSQFPFLSWGILGSSFESERQKNKQEAE